MKQRRDHQSPFGIRLHFETEEFESMMDELRVRAGSETFVENEGVDVDRVLLVALKIEADYVELPQGVLGRTLFERDGRARVEISRQLADAAETDRLARRRFRTTLAHEAGHVACHAQLFFQDTRIKPLFPGQREDASVAPKILCREEGLRIFSYRGEWWEFQANQCMACLLLPRARFIEKARALLSARNLGSFEEAIRRDQSKEVVGELSRCFDVSFEAVFYRLEAMGFVPKAGEPSLPFGN